MKLYGETDIGRMRKNNQDSFITGQISDNVVWAAVCDGMGGAVGGDVASSTACNMISQMLPEIYKDNMNDSAIKNMLVSLVLAANAKIYELSIADRSLSGMGTTIVLCLIVNNTAHIVHAGDSRAYYIKENECIRITKDHSVVQEMIDNGKIDEQQAANHPNRNLITRALGVDQSLLVDYCHQEIENNTIIMLCTDGLTNYLDKKDIIKFILGNSIEDAVKNMIACANERGGSDNITIVLLER